MKKDTITITITRAEYAHLNKAANAAVEHALELVQAARLVDDLQARITALEAERDELVVEASRFAADNNELRDDTDRLAVERDAWFSKYQVLKERTDNYEFLLYKVKEQEKEIYRLVKEINELGG